MDDLALAEVKLELGNCLLQLGEEDAAGNLIDGALRVFESAGSADAGQLARASLVRERHAARELGVNTL